MTHEDYLLGFECSYKIFLAIEEVIEQGLSPIMSSFINEELSLWEQVVKNSQNPQGAFLELGCGGGRAISRLKKYGLKVKGVDNNPLLIKHCKNRDLEVFQIDILEEAVPKKIKQFAEFTAIGFNTLFNFNKKDRKKWIDFAEQTLKPGGLLVISFYTDNIFVNKYIKERVNYYTSTLPVDGYTHRYYEKAEERGIELVNDHDQKSCLLFNLEQKRRRIKGSQNVD